MTEEMKKQYLLPDWQKKRLEILQRDEWKCLKCGAIDKQLHVHHLKYIKGRKPWEYNNGNFLTLCNDCHKHEHLNPYDKLKEEVLHYASEYGFPVTIQQRNGCQSIDNIDDFYFTYQSNKNGFADSYIKKYGDHVVLFDGDEATYRNMVILTDSLIHAGASERGGFTNAQLKILDVKMVKGWKKSLIGKAVSKDNYERFLSMKGIKKKRNKKKRSRDDAGQVVLPSWR